MKAFFAHIDKCEQCRNYKRYLLGMCPTGRKLLLAAAVPTIEHDVPKQN